MNVEDLQEFIPLPGDSYSFSAIETYNASEVFRFRTGPKVSVLEILYAEPFSIRLIGEHRVQNDQDCWDILLKFRSQQLSMIIQAIVKEAIETGKRRGELEVRTQIKDALFGKYHDF